VLTFKWVSPTDGLRDQDNFGVANQTNTLTLRADIAEMVAAMTEGETGVASERASCNTLG
jgi:hypothetical protein